MEVVSELNVFHLMSSLLIGSVGVAVFFFKTTNALDKRLTKIETQIDVGKGKFDDIKKDLSELTKSNNTLSKSIYGLIAQLRARGYINGKEKH